MLYSTLSQSTHATATDLIHIQVSRMIIPLSSLPPEIRALIFSHAVRFTHPLFRPRRKFADGCSYVAPQLSLLLANKMIHEEAAALFYELNQFRLFLPTSAYLNKNEWAIEEVTDDGEDKGEEHDLALRETSDSSAKSEMEHNVELLLDVPTRYINRLRDVIFHSRLSGWWPNGPLTDSSLGPEGLGEKELARMLDKVAEHSGILNNISIELQRVALVSGIQWDPDPLALLRELDRDRRFSRIVATLPQLRRLDIWKARKCDIEHMAMWAQFPDGGLEKGNVYEKVVEQRKLEEVRERHFEGVKSARYERRAWGEYVQTGKGDCFMKEGFVLHFV